MFLQGKWPYYYYASLKIKIFRNKNSIEICFRKSNPNAIELKKNEYSWFSFCYSIGNSFKKRHVIMHQTIWQFDERIERVPLSKTLTKMHLKSCNQSAERKTCFNNWINLLFVGILFCCVAKKNVSKVYVDNLAQLFNV
jgi:hypothetical protein